MRMYTILILLLFLLTTTVSGQLKTTYGVEGWGTHTLGGQGGSIVRVTNLNASGAGSFAAAIAMNGPRIIVFEVGGVINLNGSSISLNNPNVTIAGQTAPGKGITLINGGMNIQAHDVIMQHIRIRPGATGHLVGAWEPDGMTTNGAGKVIIDHCSFSWAVDENCSASGPRFEGATPEDWRNNTSHAVTISNNIISEGLSNSTHTKGEHSKGTLVHDNTKEIAILNNLYAHNKDRNPLFKGGARGVVVNNYIYNPGVAAVKFGLVDSEWLGYVKDTGKMTVVGNYLKYGPSTSSIAFCNIGNGPCEVYLSNNLALDRLGNPVTDYKGDVTKRVYVKPVWNDNIRVTPATEVQQNIVRNAGARPWDRDDIDKRILQEALTGTGSIIDSESTVGGYPTYQTVRVPFVEAEWNLDCMMKRDAALSIESPTSGSVFQKDSLIQVSAVLASGNSTGQKMELLLNGISQGLRTKAPYTWQLLIPETGTHQLIVISDADSLFKTVSATTKIQVAETLTTNDPNQKRATISSVVYPNPFHEKVLLKYDLTEESFVNISVLNSQGQLLGTLFSETQSMGKHEAMWAPNHRIGGLYFLLLKTGTGTSCHKVLYSIP